MHKAFWKMQPVSDSVLAGDGSGCNELGLNITHVAAPTCSVSDAGFSANALAACMAQVLPQSCLSIQQPGEPPVKNKQTKSFSLPRSQNHSENHECCSCSGPTPALVVICVHQGARLFGQPSWRCIPTSETLISQLSSLTAFH